MYYGTQATGLLYLSQLIHIHLWHIPHNHATAQVLVQRDHLTCQVHMAMEGRART